MENERIVVKGVVLRATDTKEADKMLTVLTGEAGKLSVVARGARRKTSRIAAASQLFVYSEMVLCERRGWYML
ncbi:MAG: DNA repair protein RecO, partial [Oscillospiraceae bacterium]|nr:DNA repair protein RecO [Oscillospiraceae bacterium]